MARRPQEMLEDQDQRLAAAARVSRLSRIVLMGAVVSLLLSAPAVYLLMQLDSPLANIAVGSALVILPQRRPLKHAAAPLYTP